MRKFGSFLQSRNGIILVFISFVAFIYFFYGIDQIFGFTGPRYLHEWRQSDCLSLTEHYYQGTGFLEPKMHNYLALDKTSNETAGEFPGLYYFVATIWKVFGKSELLYRIIVWSISLIGLWCLVRMTQRLLNDVFVGFIASLLLFTFALVIIYGTNFLSNIPALSCTFIGWYFFFKFYDNRFLNSLVWAMLFWMLAGLLKASELMSFGVVGLIYLMELLNVTKFKNGQKLFNAPIKQGATFLIAIGGVLAWYLYAHYYNSYYTGRYTYNSIWPIWELEIASIKYVLGLLYTDLLPKLFHNSLLWLSFLVFIFNLIFIKKGHKLMNTINVLLFLSSLVYMALWFQSFNIHDYYLISIVPFFIFNFITFFLILKNLMPNWFRSITFRAILGLFFAVQMYICSINVEVYQFAEQKDYPFFDKDKVELYSWFRWNYKTFQKPYESITPYLREIGIQSDDKVISIPDPTFNYTLYLMNQPGWTSIQHQALNKAQIKELGEDMDADYDFQDLIERGAKYLIVGRNGEYDKVKFKKIETYLKYPIGEYENIKIYDLHEYSN